MGEASMIKPMFAVLLLAGIFLALSASAQNRFVAGTPGTSGCGDPDIKFEVKMDKSKHPALLQIVGCTVKYSFCRASFLDRKYMQP
jgi:hypothetical protein